ncbi:MAG: hypothetical protein K6C94_04170 [Candidatus Gastranaerophilales bacterium]|nr:hypothetical protein [Candidatus Gastranaerophilales bacterium]
MFKMTDYFKKNLVLLVSVFAAHFVSKFHYVFYDKMSIIPTVLIFLAVCSLVYIVMDKFIKIFKKEGDTFSKTDAVFLFVFFLILFLPMMHVNPHASSVIENRKLALYKPFFKKVDGKIRINKQYSSDFDKWFGDRFNLREFYYSLAHLKYKYTDRWENDAIIQAKDGWLFFKLDNRIAEYQNLTAFKPKELAKIAKYLNSVNDYCKQHNKRFYILIIPNKDRIYPEKMPDYILKKRPDTESKTFQLINYLEKNTDIKVIYPYELLRKNKDKGILYYKQDTHWNDLGASLVYDDLIARMNADGLKIKPYDYRPLLKFQKYTLGDIYQRLPNIIRKPDENDYVKYDIPLKYNMDSTSAPKGQPYWRIPYIKTKYYGLKTPKLCVYRDSFMYALIPFLSSTFSDVTYCWTYDISEKEIREADIVILEITEVFLHYLLDCSGYFADK